MTGGLLRLDGKGGDIYRGPGEGKVWLRLNGGRRGRNKDKLSLPRGWEARWAG